MMKWEKFWKLTILWESEKRNSWIFEKCMCECWNIKYISRNHLRMWKSKSCWCVLKERWRKSLIEMNTIHWMYWTHIYTKYNWAKNRCNNKSYACYNSYGWRWIKFLWKNFEEFYKDMWESYHKHVKEYWEKNTTLDRIDVNWNYCKENCRRATCIEQANNRRNTKYYEYNWECLTLPNLCKKYNLNYDVIRNRLYKWKSLEESINYKLNLQNNDK